jgi:hypothetical protein
MDTERFPEEQPIGILLNRNKNDDQAKRGDNHARILSHRSYFSAVKSPPATAWRYLTSLPTVAAYTVHCSLPTAHCTGPPLVDYLVRGFFAGVGVAAGFGVGLGVAAAGTALVAGVAAGDADGSGVGNAVKGVG